MIKFTFLSSSHYNDFYIPFNFFAYLLTSSIFYFIIYSIYGSLLFNLSAISAKFNGGWTGFSFFYIYYFYLTTIGDLGDLGAVMFDTYLVKLLTLT